MWKERESVGNGEARGRGGEEGDGFALQRSDMLGVYNSLLLQHFDFLCERFGFLCERFNSSLQ